MTANHFFVHCCAYDLDTIHRRIKPVQRSLCGGGAHAWRSVFHYYTSKRAILTHTHSLSEPLPMAITTADSADLSSQPIRRPITGDTTPTGPTHTHHVDDWPTAAGPPCPALRSAAAIMAATSEGRAADHISDTSEDIAGRASEPTPGGGPVICTLGWSRFSVTSLAPETVDVTDRESAMSRPSARLLRREANGDLAPTTLLPLLLLFLAASLRFGPELLLSETCCRRFGAAVAYIECTRCRFR